MKKLNYFHIRVAQLVGLGYDDKQILNKFGKKPWKLTKSKLRRWKKDELFNEYASGVSTRAEDELVTSKARLTMLIVDKCVPIMEEVMDEKMHDPITGEGTVGFDKGLQRKYAFDLIKEAKVLNPEKAQQAEITLILQKEQKDEKSKKVKTFKLDIGEEK